MRCLSLRFFGVFPPHCWELLLSELGRQLKNNRNCRQQCCILFHFISPRRRRRLLLLEVDDNFHWPRTGKMTIICHILHVSIITAVRIKARRGDKWNRISHQSVLLLFIIWWKRTWKLQRYDSGRREKNMGENIIVNWTSSESIISSLIFSCFLSRFFYLRDPRPHHAAPTWNSIKREMWWGFSTAWIRYMWKTLIWFNDFVENYLIDFSSQRFLSLSPSSSTHIARSTQSTLSSAVSLVYDLMIS